MKTSNNPVLSNLFTRKNGIINVSKGPQFNTKGGAVLAIVSLILLLISGSCLSSKEYFLSLISFIICIVLFSSVLDIHGIEVDSDLHKIRDYKVYLGFRIGKWSNINDFKSIYLTQKNVIIPTSEGSDYASDTYHYYHIKFVDELNRKEIFLAEYKNYYTAQKISKDISDATGLVFKDFLKGSKNR